MVRLPGSRGLFWEIGGNDASGFEQSFRLTIYKYIRTKILFVSMHLIDLLHIIYR